MRGIALSPDDRLRAGIIERIMCDGKIDLAAAGKAFGYADDWYAPEIDPLTGLERDGAVVNLAVNLQVLPDMAPPEQHMVDRGNGLRRACVGHRLRGQHCATRGHRGDRHRTDPEQRYIGDRKSVV